MRVRSGGIEYHATFRHVHYDRPELYGSEHWIKGETVCSITQADDNLLLGVGVSRCSCGDEFKLRTGQKYALRRALDEAWPIGERHDSMLKGYDNALKHGEFFAVWHQRHAESKARQRMTHQQSHALNVVKGGLLSGRLTAEEVIERYGKQTA